MINPLGFQGSRIVVEAEINPIGQQADLIDSDQTSSDEVLKTLELTFVSMLTSKRSN